MDDNDFRKTDREMEARLRDSNNTLWENPTQFEWIPVGEYNGVDIPGIYIDENYVVYIEVKCPEYGE